MTLFAALLDEIWKWTAGKADLGKVEFSSLKRPSSPNYCLVCPKEFCGSFRPNIPAPEFDLDAVALRAELNRLVLQEPNIVLVESDEDTLEDRFVQRSNVLRFPDTITVRYLALEGNRSTLAIYSRSQIGYSDMGVNKKRLERWLGLLSETTAN